MPSEAVRAVLERAVTDAEFRTRLFAEPDQALAEYDLSAGERQALRDISAEGSRSQSSALDRRETKAALPLWLTGGR
jgi:hypothetical protein